MAQLGLGASFLTVDLKVPEEGTEAAAFAACLRAHSDACGAPADAAVRDAERRRATEFARMRRDGAAPERSDQGVARLMRYYCALEEMEKRMCASSSSLDSVPLKTRWSTSLASGRQGATCERGCAFSFAF